MAAKARSGKSAPKIPGDKMMSVGHHMGGLFGVTPKKSEPDDRPPSRAGERARKARVQRLLKVKL